MEKIYSRTKLKAELRHKIFATVAILPTLQSTGNKIYSIEGQEKVILELYDENHFQNN